MRALLAAILLTAAALAAVPAASALSVPPKPAVEVYGPDLDPLCVPPDGFQLVACVVQWGSYTCLAARVGPPVHAVCADPAQPDAAVCLFDRCSSVRALAAGTVVCVPPGALNGACAGDVGQGLCAWYWGGANHSSVCLAGGPGVVACTTHLWDDDPEASYECRTLA
jgi:hypothetical protein